MVWPFKANFHLYFQMAFRGLKCIGSVFYKSIDFDFSFLFCNIIVKLIIKTAIFCCVLISVVMVTVTKMRILFRHFLVNNSNLE